MRSTLGLLTDMARGITNKNTGPPVPFMGRDTTRTLFSDNNEISGDRVFDAYGSVGTLFAIVRQIGDAFSTTEWSLFRKTSIREEARRKEITSHALLDLWNKPNEFYDGQHLREMVQQHLDLIGEGIIVLNTVQLGGKDVPIEMWAVRPDRVKPIKHPKKYLTGWMYVSPDGEEVPLKLSQVIQIKYPNPKDPYRGMGPVQSALADIDAAKYSADWNRNFFINGARPGGIIKVDYRMTDDELEEFIQRWRSQHQGVSNAHRVAVLENAEWQDTQFSMTDMQFVEMRNLSREMIREAFAYPKPMLGAVDDVNRANGKVGEVIFARWQILPRLRRWKNVLNFHLLPRYANGQNLVLDFVNPVPVDLVEETAVLDKRATAYQRFVQAGVDPDSAAETCGLPEMAMASQVAPSEESEQIESNQSPRKLLANEYEWGGS
jgi:HK97 family phage portal protein